MDPCRQEDAIDDIKRTLDRVAGALESIAAQAEAIKHIQETQRDQKKDINALFSRVRSIELQPARELSKVKVAVVSSAISALCSGVGSFALAHFMR